MNNKMKSLDEFKYLPTGKMGWKLTFYLYYIKYFVAKSFLSSRKKLLLSIIFVIFNLRNFRLYNFDLNEYYNLIFYDTSSCSFKTLPVWYCSLNSFFFLKILKNFYSAVFCLRYIVCCVGLIIWWFCSLFFIIFSSRFCTMSGLSV